MILVFINCQERRKQGKLKNSTEKPKRKETNGKLLRQQTNKKQKKQKTKNNNNNNNNNNNSKNPSLKRSKEKKCIPSQSAVSNSRTVPPSTVASAPPRP